MAAIRSRAGAAAVLLAALCCAACDDPSGAGSDDEGLAPVGGGTPTPVPSASAGPTPSGAPVAGTLSLDPPELNVALAPGETPPELTFRLLEADGAGARVAIPAAEVQWSVDDRRVGTIDAAGHFVAAALGGRTLVRARYELREATALVHVSLREVIVVPGAEALPDRFEAATPGVAGDGPPVIYPEDGALLPRNVAPILIQWEGPERDAYRLRVRAGASDVEVFTTDWKWSPDETLWRRLVQGGLEGGLRVAVSRLAADGSVADGPPIRLELSYAEVRGAVYYWSPGMGGIVRLPVGATQPEPFLADSVFACAGCHALSPDGSRIAYTRGTASPIGPLGVIGTDAARTEYIAPQSGIGAGVRGYYPSFAPDNVHLAVAREGDITIIDTDTAQDVTTLSAPNGEHANYPAWSPLDDAVVFAAGQRPSGGIGEMASLGISRSGLVKVRRNADGSWAAPFWLLQPGGARNASEAVFYPAYSPDGRWLAFNRADSSVLAGGSPAGAELCLLDANGGSVIFLEAAQGHSGITNSWPKWAPATGDGRLWLAFTSSRPYGRMPLGGSQIWISGVTPGRLAEGPDPSAPAFWMPFQDMTQSNHVAYWAEFRKEDLDE